MLENVKFLLLTFLQFKKIIFYKHYSQKSSAPTKCTGGWRRAWASSWARRRAWPLAWASPPTPWTFPCSWARAALFWATSSTTPRSCSARDSVAPLSRLVVFSFCCRLIQSCSITILKVTTITVTITLKKNSQLQLLMYY